MRLSLSAGVELRVLTATDAEDLHALICRNIDWLSPWMEWAHPEFSKAETLLFLERSEQGLRMRSDFNFGVRKAGELVGNVGLHVLSRRDRTARIGYWLDEKATGQGLVTNAVRAIVEFAFNDLETHRIEIRCAPANRASRAIPERLGFTEEGTNREALRLRDRYQDLVMYSLLRTDPGATA
ncbi:MAG TPA: GNAT family protein [Candidatus Rubrimentiphilum sp.]|nr:GNAT family protein [Candidatus Rubrimentiphilum sp.]